MGEGRIQIQQDTPKWSKWGPWLDMEVPKQKIFVSMRISDDCWHLFPTKHLVGCWWFTSCICYSDIPQAGFAGGIFYCKPSNVLFRLVSSRLVQLGWIKKYSVGMLDLSCGKGTGKCQLKNGEFWGSSNQFMTQRVVSLNPFSCFWICSRRLLYPNSRYSSPPFNNWQFFW